MSEHIDAKRLLIPQLGPLYGFFGQYSYAFMRICTGAILIPHGVGKMFSDAPWQTAPMERMGLWPPLLWAMLVAGTEFFGPIFLTIGLFTRFAAAVVMIEMFVIAYFINGPKGFLWTRGGYEYPLLWGLLCLAILFRGGGRLSVDQYLPKEL